MNAPVFHERLAIRSYNEVQRDAIHATEREAFITSKSAGISNKSAADIQAPEPCNFCAPDDHGSDMPESWSDTAFFLWSTLIALCVASAAEWHHFFGAWVP